MNGPKEELLYVVCIQPDLENKKGDFLATVDVNPTSPTFCKVNKIYNPLFHNNHLVLSIKDNSQIVHKQP